MPRELAAFRPRSLPIVTVRRDSWAIRALADTGAQTSLVHPRLVLQLGLPTIGDLPSSVSDHRLHGCHGSVLLTFVSPDFP
jgi:hypothetical protein